MNRCYASLFEGALKHWLEIKYVTLKVVHYETSLDSPLCNVLDFACDFGLHMGNCSRHQGSSGSARSIDTRPSSIPAVIIPIPFSYHLSS